MEEAYASSTLMNIESQPIRTIEEQKTNPYAENIITMCYYDEDVELTHGLDKDNTITYLSDYDDEEYILRILHNKTNPYVTITDLIHNNSVPFSKILGMKHLDKKKSYWPCKVYERSDITNTYSVQIFQSPIMDDTEWTLTKSPQFVTNVPREYISFHTRPYKSDMFMKGVLRHAIHIHDDIFPESWKNLKSKM